MKSLRLLTIFLITAAMNTFLHAEDSKLHSIPLKDIDGNKTSLKAFAGKAILVVNVASKCGLTQQYKALQALYDKYESQGLVLVGFPSNDFGGQEPGTNAEVKQFCEANFKVSFPLMDKIKVKGEGQHPLYAELTGANSPFPGEVKWNFGKFLIGRDGKLVARFEPKTTPDAEEVTKAIEAELAKK